MAKISITLKDPDGVYEGVFKNQSLSEEDKEYLCRKYFPSAEYLNLQYDTETKVLEVESRN